MRRLDGVSNVRINSVSYWKWYYCLQHIHPQTKYVYMIKAHTANAPTKKSSENFCFINKKTHTIIIITSCTCTQTMSFVHGKSSHRRFFRMRSMIRMGSMCAFACVSFFSWRFLIVRAFVSVGFYLCELLS